MKRIPPRYGDRPQTQWCVTIPIDPDEIRAEAEKEGDHSVELRAALARLEQIDPEADPVWFHTLAPDPDLVSHLLGEYYALAMEKWAREFEDTWHEWVSVEEVPIGWVCDGADDCVYTTRWYDDGPMEYAGPINHPATRGSLN